MTARTRRLPARLSIRRRTAFVSAGVAFAVAMVSAPVSANHTEGVLDCGSAGTFTTEAGSALPRGFEAPGPWSGLFLLEGTTQVFRAFSIVTPAWRIDLVPATRHPGALVTCTLTSEGPNFEQPWTLKGVLIP